MRSRVCGGEGEVTGTAGKWWAMSGSPLGREVGRESVTMGRSGAGERVLEVRKETDGTKREWEERIRGASGASRRSFVTLHARVSWAYVRVSLWTAEGRLAIQRRTRYQASVHE